MITLRTSQPLSFHCPAPAGLSRKPMISLAPPEGHRKGAPFDLNFDGDAEVHIRRAISENHPAFKGPNPQIAVIEIPTKAGEAKPQGKAVASGPAN